MRSSKIAAFFASLCIIISMIQPVFAETPAEADASCIKECDAAAKMSQFISEHEESSADPLAASGRAYRWIVSGGFILCGSDCMGFVMSLSDYIFGTFKVTPVTCQLINASFDCCVPLDPIPYAYENLMIGDIINYPGHSLIVKEKYADYIVAAESYSGKCHYTRTFSREGIESCALSVYTRFNKTALTQDQQAVIIPFVDVIPGKFYYEALVALYRACIVAGTDATHFEPKQPCTRAQLVSLIYRFLGEPELDGEVLLPFTDVRSDAYYYTALCYCFKEGIICGVDETHFDPHGECTRAMAVVAIYRVVGQPEVDRDCNPFKDLKDGSYYFDAVLYAYQHGITHGVSEDRFDPKSTLTRGQLITFLFNLMRS